MARSSTLQARVRRISFEPGTIDVCRVEVVPTNWLKRGIVRTFTARGAYASTINSYIHTDGVYVFEFIAPLDEESEGEIISVQFVR